MPLLTRDPRRYRSDFPTERDGLLSNTVNGVRVGRDDRIWISSQKGVLRVERAAFDRVDRETAQAATAEAAGRTRSSTLASEDESPALDPDCRSRGPRRRPCWCR